MSFFPDLVDGKLVEEKPKASVDDVTSKFLRKKVPQKKKDESNLSDLNNLGHKPVSEDFSDSPHLNI